MNPESLSEFLQLSSSQKLFFFHYGKDPLNSALQKCSVSKFLLPNQLQFSWSVWFFHTKEKKFVSWWDWFKCWAQSRLFEVHQVKFVTLELCCIFLSMCCITGDLLKFICPQDQGLLGKMHHHLESQSEMTQQKQEQILMWSISWFFIS